jgi:hypothetical protein
MVAWNNLVRQPLAEPTGLGDAAPRGAGSRATMAFTSGYRIKRARTQGSVTIVLVEPKQPPVQTARRMERVFISYRRTDSVESKEWMRAVINKLKVHGTLSSGITGEPTSARAVWEPLRSVRYTALPVKLTEEVSAAARELVQQLVPARAQLEAPRARAAENVEAQTSSKSVEEFLVSGQVTDFVLRGVQATSEIANRQFAADERWAALADLLPTQDPSTPLLRQAITRRVRRMFRSLASEAREDGSQMRLLAGTASWSIHVQYEIIDRLPIRPDETSEFLRALLLDISTALRSGVRIGGGWGYLQISAEGELTLAVAPRGELEDFARASSPVRFTRIRRGANPAPP